jgi:hypothetical protein
MVTQKRRVEGMTQEEIENDFNKIDDIIQTESTCRYMNTIKVKKDTIERNVTMYAHLILNNKRNTVYRDLGVR